MANKNTKQIDVLRMTLNAINKMAGNQIPFPNLKTDVSNLSIEESKALIEIIVQSNNGQKL